MRTALFVILFSTFMQIQLQTDNFEQLVHMFSKCDPHYLINQLIMAIGNREPPSNGEGEQDSLVAVVIERE